MDREAVLRRRAELLAAEQGEECRWFWLSFAGDEGFLGGCFILAPGFATAVERARDLGLNPGGEVLGFEVDRDKTPPKELLNRLLSKDDLEAHGGGAVRMNKDLPEE